MLYSQEISQQTSIIDTVLIKAFNIEIKLKDTNALTTNNNDEKWLNDNIIDFYFNMIKDTERNKHLECDINVLSSFEFKRFLNNKEFIKHDSNRCNIFKHDYIIIPICYSNHWSLVNIHIKQKKVRFFDSCTSLESNDKRKILIKEFVSFIIDNDARKKDFSTNLSEWVFRNESKLPQQCNNFDCGLFICLFAKIISYSAKIIPSQYLENYLLEFRCRMFDEIKNFELFDNEYNYVIQNDTSKQKI
jgi:sentrin-specific protease 1